MKKLVMLGVVLSLFAVPAAYAYDTGRSEDGYFTRCMKIEGRGFLNLLSIPAELVRTPVVEARAHKWVWPVTSVPRFFSNLVSRIVSGAYDIVFSPFIQPFTNEITPLTDPMGLPDYGWQFHEGDF